MSDTHKYYWLKLKRDFFKRHDIRIVESLENGKDYLIFYMKLLVESIDHEGYLRFSETIPYDEKMLSTITDTNIDVVRSACKLFGELGMMEWEDDGTLFMNQVQGMIGSETSDAIRKRDYREKAKQIIAPKEQEGHCPGLSQKRAPELDIELEKDIEKEKREDRAKALPSPIDKSKKENERKTLASYGEGFPVYLSDEEKTKLTRRYSEAIILDYIERVSLWQPNDKKRPQNDYMTLLNWLRRDKIPEVKYTPVCRECKKGLATDGAFIGHCWNDNCKLYHCEKQA